MTLDEAIAHAERVAAYNEHEGAHSCATEHAQIAIWLRELRDLRKGKQCPLMHGEVISMCCDACETIPAAHFSGTIKSALVWGWYKSDRGWVCPTCYKALKKPRWENPDNLPTCRTCLNEPQIRNSYCALASGVVDLDKPHKPGTFDCYRPKSPKESNDTE